MARPSLIRPVSGGEIILKNIDPELASSIKKLVADKENKSEPVAMLANVVPVATEAGPVVAPISNEGTHPMPRTAIGTYKDENELYKFVYVKYNPKSLQARVDKVVNIGFEQMEASEKFKIEAVKTGQVV